MMNDPKFIKDLQDQMEMIEAELDDIEQHPAHYPIDTSRFCNLVREHSDLEDVLNSLLDDDGHDAP